MALTVNSITQTIKNMFTVTPAAAPVEPQWFIIPVAFTRRHGLWFADFDMAGWYVAAQYFGDDNTLYSGVVAAQKTGKLGTTVFFVPDAGQGIYSDGKWISVSEIEGYLTKN